MSTLQLLMQGIHTKKASQTSNHPSNPAEAGKLSAKQGSGGDHTSGEANKQGFSVDSEKYTLSEADQELFAGVLSGIKTNQQLNSPQILEDRTIDEQKAIHRRRTALATFLKDSQMKLSGDNIPLPLMTFDDIKSISKCPDSLLGRLRGLNYLSPTPIQAQSIPASLNRRNCICIAPTGSGKTVAYTLPLLLNLLADREGLEADQEEGKAAKLKKLLALKKKDPSAKLPRKSKALIVAPTFELSLQIYSVVLQLLGRSSRVQNQVSGVQESLPLIARHINKMNFKSETDEERADLYAKELEEIDILVTTPLKFINIAQMGVNMDSFDYVVLDEADKYFELGFMDQFKQLTEVLKVSQKTYSLFSATLPSQIEKELETILVDPVSIVIRGKLRVLDSIKQELKFCGNEYGKLVQLKNMKDQGALKVPCLVFIQSKERAKELHREISSLLDIPVAHIESNQNREKRTRLINDFTSGKTWMLITTDLLARGIDFPLVRLVVNFDMPTSTVNYIHRVGRTGRGGQTGEAVTFYTKDDKLMLRKLADLLKVSGCEVPEWIFSLSKPSRQAMSQLGKRPVERESLDPTKRTDEYYRYRHHLKKQDRSYIERFENAEKGIIQQGEKDPRVLMASKMKEMAEQGDN